MNDEQIKQLKKLNKTECIFWNPSLLEVFAILAFGKDSNKEPVVLLSGGRHIELYNCDPKHFVVIKQIFHS